MTRSRSSIWPLLVLSAATFTTVSAEMMPTGVLDQLSASMSVTNSTAGLLVTVWAVTIAVTSIPLVRATIRWRRRPLILLALGIMSAANIMTALAPTYVLMLVLRVIGAAAHGVFWAVVVAYAATLVPPERVGRALSIVLAGPTRANLVSLPVGSALAHAIGWQATFIGLAAACALCVLLIALVVPANEGAAGEMKKGAWDRSAIPVVWVAGSGFFALVRLYALFTFVVPVSEAVAGIASVDMPGVLLASGIGGVAGVLLAGRVSDRWPTRALPVTVVVLAVVLATIGLAQVAAVYIFSTVLWGVMIGILPVVLHSNVMRLASPRFRPLAGSILVTVLNLGVGLGAALGSIVSSRDGLQVLPFIASAVVAFAIVPLLLLSPRLRQWQALVLARAPASGSTCSRRGHTVTDTVTHANAPLSPEGRRRLVERCRTRPIAHVASEMGVSRATAPKWVNRYKRFGDLGLIDRSSVPRRQPTATPGALVTRIEYMRREHKWSASRIAFELRQVGTPVSRRTITRLLAQLGLNQRRFIGPNGESNREPQKIVAERPGHMIHIDVKKTGRVPDGGGWRVHGKGSAEDKAVARAKMRGAKTGYVFLHSAIDGYSRLAYTEALEDEKAATAVAFLDRAKVWFAAHGIAQIERIVTDNGSCYRARLRRRHG